MAPSLLGWAIFGGFVLALGGLFLWRWAVGRRRPGYLAVTEYWVYGRAERLPKIEAVMDRMVSANPHNRPGRPCIGAREGMLFTDLRLHMAVARRDRNPFAFRPDLFDRDVYPSALTLDGLAESTALVKLRYASREPLRDDRHLQFMPHLADAIADLTGGLVVFDTVRESLETTVEFKAKLAEDNRGDRPALHLRVCWIPDEPGFRAETRGLRKVGLDELRTQPQEADHEVIVTTVLARVAERLFRSSDTPWPIELLEAGDVFRLESLGLLEGQRLVKIVRVHGGVT